MYKTARAKNRISYMRCSDVIELSTKPCRHVGGMLDRMFGVITHTHTHVHQFERCASLGRYTASNMATWCTLGDIMTLQSPRVQTDFCGQMERRLKVAFAREKKFQALILKTG